MIIIQTSLFDDINNDEKIITSVLQIFDNDEIITNVLAKVKHDYKKDIENFYRRAQPDTYTLARFIGNLYGFYGRRGNLTNIHPNVYAVSCQPSKGIEIVVCADPANRQTTKTIKICWENIAKKFKESIKNETERNKNHV